MPLHRYGLIREVMLHSQGKPLLLARTVIPDETIKVAHRNLAHLGTRPLGEVIFSYPDLERLTMDLTLVEAEKMVCTSKATGQHRSTHLGQKDGLRHSKATDAGERVFFAGDTEVGVAMSCHLPFWSASKSVIWQEIPLKTELT